MGLREYSIHCAVTHYQLEVAMEDDQRPGIEEVRAAIIQHRNTVHMAHEHGGVLTVMANSDNEAVQEVGRRFQKIVK